jgi:hypothetical protein
VSIGYTSQTWFRLLASSIKDAPTILNDDDIERIQSNKELNEEAREKLLSWARMIQTGEMFFEQGQSQYPEIVVRNLHLSRCYVCEKLAVWVHDAVVSPFNKDGPPHHSDMPEDIARDYDEARTILKMSPRGAAALLRLCVQKLCDELGQKGKKIDAAIAGLVGEGLSPVISEALDSVRVIGNEAVHPGGVMDLRDDHDTAVKLFGLVNVIVDRMISHPKQVRDLYETLPPEKRAAIDARNAKATGQKSE